MNLYATGVFLDTAQAFDKVWHQNHLLKLKLIRSHTYSLILQSFLFDKFFLVRQGSNIYSSYFNIYSYLVGVPQGSAPAPLLYIVCTYDISVSNETLLLMLKTNLIN